MKVYCIIEVSCVLSRWLILLFYLLHHYYYYGCQYYKGTKQIWIAACVVEFTGLQSNVLVCKLQFYTVKFTRFIYFLVINVFTVFLLTKLFLQPQLPKWFSKKIHFFFFFYLKSAKLEQLVLFLMHFNCAKVQLKIYWSIFDCAKVELLQVYFKHILDKYKKNCIVHK